MRVWAVIPALDEEDGLRRVLREIPPCVENVVVVDNGSRDRTADVAREEGAHVVEEPRRGYGAACLRGIAALPSDVDVVVFLDADHADHPDRIPSLLEPIAAGEADLVIGSRALGPAEKGALTPQARFGNWLATWMIFLLFGHRFTDLGPMRAVRREALERLGMRDRTYGWTVEMQVRALQEGLACAEVPVPYRRRRGRSKISGTLRGTLLAGWKIITTILALRLRGGRRAA